MKHKINSNNNIKKCKTINNSNNSNYNNNSNNSNNSNNNSNNSNNNTNNNNSSNNNLNNSNNSNSSNNVSNDSENFTSVQVVDIKPETIKYNYAQRPIDIQFMEEQKRGVNLNTWYPNTWIERIDEDGIAHYNSRDNVTGKRSTENFIEEKARFSYDFVDPKTYNMSGVVDPSELVDNRGKTLKEVYENSFVDYKKMVPNQEAIEMDVAEQEIPDNWVYKNERIENGGEIVSGLYASDPYFISNIASFN